MIVETPIVFVSHGAPLAGRLFRAAAAGAARQPAVVVSGSWLTVKELARLDGEQSDFDDRPQHVAAAVERADAWFSRTLRG